MKEQVVYGLNNVHVAKLTKTDGQITYGKPIKIPGAVNFSADPEGDTSKFSADNRTYFMKTANNGYSGTLEIADVPEEFLTEILGQKKDRNGAIIENSGDKDSEFALMCEMEGDPSQRRIVFYDSKATRPTISTSTNEEGVEVKTASMDLTMAPRSTDGQVKAVLDLTEENKAVYDTFFDKVYEKDASASV